MSTTSPPHSFFPVKITSKRLISDRVAELILTSVSGDDLPTWTPGAHIDLDLPNHPRQYSLCGNPEATDQWRIAVLREVEGRGGSEYVHTQLAEGAVVGVSEPRNHFQLEPAAAYLFIGGGIGITPLLPMIRAVAAAGKEWRLVYGGRSRDCMPYVDEVSEWGDRVTLWPQDELGLIDLAGLLGEPAAGVAVYACGPEPMLEAIEARAHAWPADAVHMERFKALELDDSANTSFEIELANSGQTFTVPADKSILQVLRDGDVYVDWSCEEGTCGTCEVGLIEGEADHRDSVYTVAEQEAQDMLITCVSRARSARLKLDL